MDSQTALKELQTFQGNRKSAGDYYTAAQQELGAGSAQQRANEMRGLIRNTETALKGVDASVSGRTQGSLVTEAQRARLANLERQPLAEQLGGLQSGYSDEMANYRDLVSQAGTKAGLQYQSDQDRLAALEGNYQRLFGQEQAAEERRRYEADLAERKRQADLSAKAARDAAFQASVNTQQDQVNWEKILSALTTNNKPKPPSPSPITIKQAPSTGVSLLQPTRGSVLLQGSGRGLQGSGMRLQ